MADLLPIDTTSPAVAELTPNARREGMSGTPLPTPEEASDRRQSLEARNRRIAARRHLRAAARAAGMTVAEYRKAGLLAEQHHQIFDLDADSAYTIPGAVYGSYLNLGGQS